MARLNMIGIIVEDMPRALAFYRKLGLDIPESQDSEGHVEITLEGGIRLAWDTIEVIKMFNDDWPSPSGHRLGMAFLCDSCDGVDELYQTMMDAGYESHKEPWDAFWGQRYAVIKDPDGNLVDLFANK